MKMTLAGAAAVALAGAFALAPNTARATDYGLPWCIVYTGDYMRSCDFQTKAQCDATATGLVGYCTPNPAVFSSTAEAYRQAEQPPPPPPLVRRRR